MTGHYRRGDPEKGCGIMLLSVLFVWLLVAAVVVVWLVLR